MAFTTSSVILALALSASPVAEEPQTTISLASTAAISSPAESGPGGDSRRVIEAWMIDAPERRPAMLPALYATLGAMQALDVYSTRRAMSAGAYEANPLMRKASGNTGAMLAVKAASTAATVFFTERAWKKNKKGAVILMLAVNGAMAAVTVRNFKNERSLSAVR
jgi:hypothetical protein